MARFPQVGDTFGPYTIIGQLGQGHAGVVFRARRADAEKPSEDLALKVIRPRQASQADFRSRFLTVSRQVARSTNEHVISVRDVGEHAGCLFIATDLVPGGDLGSRLTAGGALPATLAGSLSEQVAIALHATHASGLLHGNLKPSNILLGERDGLPHVYLCDFGILPAVGAVGLNDYLAPERLSGSAPTRSSDLYALGCVLVAAVTGAAPYQGTEREVAEQHISSPVPAWEELTPVHERLNHLVRRSMAKDPERRYLSAEEFRADLVATEVPGTPAPETPQTTPAAAASLSQTPEQRAGQGPSSARGGRRRALIGAAAALVLLIGAVAGAVAVTRDGDEDPAVTPGPAASPSEADGAPKTCQEGTRQVPAGKQCGEPYGLPGLRFVFADITADCVGARPGRTVAWQYVCQQDGVTVTYSTFTTNPANRRYHEARFARSARKLPSGLLQFGPEEIPDGSFEISLVYDGTHPYAVSVSSGAPERSQEVVDDLEVRSPDAFRGD